MKSQTVYRKIRRRILASRIPAGERIIERTLAKDLGVSVIPLRDSLIRLEAEGLVRRVPNSATYTLNFDKMDVCEISLMRILLEPVATRLAAQAPENKQLVRRLRTLCRHIERSLAEQNLHKLAEVDLEFHEAIVAACGNTRLQRAYEYSHIRLVQIGPWRNDLFRRPLEVILQEHVQLVQLIEQRDGEKAEKAARRHAWLGMKVCEQVFDCQMDLAWLAPECAAEAVEEFNIKEVDPFRGNLSAE